jgi:flagellar hook assembly protein FlgD
MDGRKLIPVLLCVLLLICAAAGAEGLRISVPETVRGYTPCNILVTAPFEGEAELKMTDPNRNVWLVRKEQLEAGENVLDWDGLGEFGERMFAGPYRFTVKMQDADGTEISAEAKFTINGTTQTLVYALPSSETLYLDRSEKWFVECFVSAECLVRMEVEDADGKVVYARDEEIKNPDGATIAWSGAVNSLKNIPEGEYTVRTWSKLNPSYAHSFPLTVKASAPPKPEIAATGPVVPERGMSEEEIWEIMMKPSVVIDDNGSSRRFGLYTVPKTGTRTESTLRCALQGLEVLDTDGPWAHIRAWRHEDGQQVEGYYLLKKLTVYTPSPHYGVLIDKREQTLTLYENGHAVGSVPVSTGLVTPGNSYRETPAGAFLTDVHNGASFAQEGYRYEYPLRYDGGNFIHGAGYVRDSRVRDYSGHQELLGQKASHGCTRVSVMLQEGCSFNMYWLWAHLPYHTRVIVLDD